MKIRIPLAALIASSSLSSFALDIPTGAPPSPLFGATEFSQKMLMFEEFGTQPLLATEAPSSQVLPAPLTCDGFPQGEALDAFLSSHQLYPLPRVSAVDQLANPWQSKIKECVPTVRSTVMEGRPPGEFFSHQRWKEFFPQVFFQSAQTGSRVNGGVRDAMQRHLYQVGEFGPGGLYHQGGTTRGTEIRFHPLMPVQEPQSVWTFDGTLPPKLLMARYGEPILFRHFNALPIERSANHGFGEHTISTHLHNGHNPAESDGFAHAFFFPGQYYDYRWPMVLAGYDTINHDAKDPRAGAPDGRGGILQLPGDPGEVGSTLWFHDHMLDYTAQNVYKGNAAMINQYSSVDRGREPRTLAEAQGRGGRGYACHYANGSSPNLCLPSGSGLDWGNRDYDVNLLIADKAWDSRGQLFFNIFNTDGFLGDRMTVNFLYKPYLDVRARRYRFRVLNGSVSRYLKLALVDQKGRRVPFHLIANDGNLMEYAIPFPNAQSSDLPEQGIAERYDIIVDFSRFKPGDRLYLVNLLEHEDGKGPHQVVSLTQVLSNQYQGDPSVGKFLEFRVQAMLPGSRDLSMNPMNYEPGKLKMIPRPKFTAEELSRAKHRTFEFGRSEGTDRQPWTIKTDGGAGLTADPHRISAAPKVGDVEIWHLKNGGGGWSHPVHIHFEEGQIQTRGGNPPPIWELWARKDVFRVGPLSDSTQSVDIAYRFREFAGTFVEHCHNTQHEDHAMLLRWDLEHPGQTQSIPTPMPSWEGVFYEDSFKLDGAR